MALLLKWQNKVQNTKVGGWLNQKINNFPDQPIQYDDEGPVTFRVQQKISNRDINPTRKEKKGDIVIRRFRVSLDGVQILLDKEDDIILEFPFGNIRKFFYAPDKCFVVLEALDRDLGVFENYVFYTSRQAPVVETVINDFVRINLENRKPSKQPITTLELSRENLVSPNQNQYSPPKSEEVYDPFQEDDDKGQRDSTNWVTFADLDKESKSNNSHISEDLIHF